MVRRYNHWYQKTKGLKYPSKINLDYMFAPFDGDTTACVRTSSIGYGVQKWWFYTPSMAIKEWEHDDDPYPQMDFLKIILLVYLFVGCYTKVMNFCIVLVGNLFSNKP
jgi:hypothetical protein